MKHFGFFFLSGIFLLSGCNSTSTVKPKYCDNTFVLSGYGQKIFLFEHQEKGVNFHLLQKYNGGIDAFYDCKHNTVVAYKFHKVSGSNNTEGIVEFNVDNDNRKELYPMKEGYNGLLARYKNGFLFATAKLRRGLADRQKLGCIPNSNVLMDKSGTKWYKYTNAHFFDLDQKKITRTYPFDLWDNAELIGDELYTFFGNFVKVNLKTGKEECLLKDDKIEPPINSNIHTRVIPKKTVRLYVGGTLYVITSFASWDTARNRTNKKLIHFNKGAIYKIANKKIVYVAQLPFDDVVYANSPDKKSLYIFTKSRKVMKFDLQRNKLIEVYNINVDLSGEYELGTVGFTNSVFVLTFQKGSYRDTYVVTANKDFSKYGKPYRIPIGGADVTSQATVQTSYRRTNNL